MEKNICYLSQWRRILKSFMTCLGFLVSPNMIAQQSYTFTSAGAFGRFGPSQAQVTSSYSNTSLSGAVTVSAGIQSWTVPISGNYRLSATGARGGSNQNYQGGLAAMVQGEFYLASGTVLNILVGQRGELLSGSYANNNTGGGGGSFVWISGHNLPLLAAGGGGGAGYLGAGTMASTTTAGQLGVGTAGLVGLNGNGATPGGGGWFSNGGNFSISSVCSPKCTGNTVGLVVGGATPTTTILYHGCAGTISTGDGGFGGGSGGIGACTLSHGGGGGGGYSGGVGQSGGVNGNGFGGGGGGSFNGGNNQVNTPGVITTDGSVVIQALCTASIAAFGLTENGGICTSNSATLVCSASSSYSWSTGVTSQSIVITPSVSGVYWVKNSHSGGCSTVDSIDVQVIGATPTVVAASSQSAICQGSSAMLSAISAVNNFTWQPGNHTSSVVLVTPILNTVYTLTASDGSCSNTATLSLLVNPSPSLSILGSSTVVCLTQGFNLSASGAATYSWSSFPATANISATQNVMSASFTNAGTYSFVVLGTSLPGCTDTAQWIVKVHPLPALTASASKTQACTGDTVLIKASGADQYLWSLNSGSFTNDSIVVTAVNSSTYSVTGTLNATGCAGTASVSLMVFPTPSLVITPSRSFACLGESLFLVASGANSFTWNGVFMDDTLSLTLLNTQAISLVLIGADTTNCQSSISYQVIVNECQGISESKNRRVFRYYPNPSSGAFFVESDVDVRLRLTNHLGQLIRLIQLNDTNYRRAEISDLAKGIYFLSSENLLTGEAIKIMVE